MRITPATELINRTKNLQKEMAIHSLDAILMVQNADLFYFTGSIQQGAFYIPVEGEPLYLVRKDHGRARMESGHKEVLPFRSPKDIPGILAGFGYKLPERLGMELTREKPGTGLGLYIVRSQVRRLNGRIRVADRDPAPGTVFEVQLPDVWPSGRDSGDGQMRPSCEEAGAA